MRRSPQCGWEDITSFTRISLLLFLIIIINTISFFFKQKWNFENSTKVQKFQCFIALRLIIVNNIFHVKKQAIITECRDWMIPFDFARHREPALYLAIPLSSIYFCVVNNFLGKVHQSAYPSCTCGNYRHYSDDNERSSLLYPPSLNTYYL